MSIIVFIATSMLPAVLTALIVSRKRQSLSYFLTLGASSLAACLLVSLLVLFPMERVQFAIEGGGITFRYGSAALLAYALLSAVSGAVFGRFVQEKASPAVRERWGIRILRIAALLLFLVALILSKAYLWGTDEYPDASFDEIMFYLRMPLQGTAQGFIDSVVHIVLLPSFLIFAAVSLLTYAPVRRARELWAGKRRIASILPLRLPLVAVYAALIIWLGVVFHAGDQMLNIRGYLAGYFSTSELIADEYVSPDSVSLTFPEKKRNLITIYLESAETTPQDIANGGVLEKSCIPEMTRIAKENISFSRSQRLEGASIPPGCGWTIAGLVAQSAGLPLKMFETKGTDGNDGDQFSVMLPGAVTLGEILRREGYRCMFMAGSDFTFGGRRVYYQTHGNYEVWDYLTAIERGKIPEDYYYAWGFEDQKLYEYAKEELTALSAGDQPFHFAMLTVDAHSPGYRCELCPTEYIDSARYSLNYADILRCGSMQLDAFLNWCSEQPFYENTTIVVTGDHASMQKYFYGGILEEDYRRDTGETNRLVYNAFINAAAEPVKEENRIFTTMDFFPTTLAAMGVSIEGDKLGLGVNLFSSVPTLAEEYGEETLFSEMNKRSVFYEEELLYPKE